MEHTQQFTGRLLNAIASVRSPQKFEPPLSEEEAKQQSKILKALGEPTRLRILSLLAKHGGEVTVFEIVDVFSPLAQPSTSHHLRVLREAGLVGCSKKGTYVYYFVHFAALVGLRDLIEGLERWS